MEEFYLKHKTYMFHLAKKFSKSQPECEDIIQDAMIRLLCNADSLLELTPNQIDTYLFLTIRSAFLDRQRKTRGDVLSISMEGVDHLSAEQNTLIYNEDMNPIWDTEILKKQLAEKEWHMLELKYIAGYTDQEIAKDIHCAPDSVRMLIRRIRNKAKKILISEHQQGK